MLPSYPQQGTLAKQDRISGDRYYYPSMHQGLHPVWSLLLCLCHRQTRGICLVEPYPYQPDIRLALREDIFQCELSTPWHVPLFDYFTSVPPLYTGFSQRIGCDCLRNGSSSRHRSKSTNVLFMLHWCWFYRQTRSQCLIKFLPFAFNGRP